MARIGGRSVWFSWFVGIVCVGVVAGLVFLAGPMVPAVVDWSGQALRGDLGQRPEPATTEGAEETVSDPTSPGLPATCADLYPESLWSLLSTATGVELEEGAQPVSSRVSGLADAVDARVTLSCTWRGGTDTAVSTTIAEVAADAPDAVGRVLAGAGFACSPFGLGVRCSGEVDGSSETHTVRDGVWVATIESGWEPPEYAATVEAGVWGP